MKFQNINLIRVAVILGLILCSFSFLQAEEKKSSTKVTGKIFTNWAYDLTEDANTESAFQVQRAYFGLKHGFNSKLSAKITMDIDYKADDGQFTTYLKNALLKWKMMPQLTTQEKHWGYRYLYKSFNDANKFSSSAELGLKTSITPHEMINVNLSVVNGEGYKKNQDADGYYKLAGDVILKPAKGLTAKVHYNAAPTRETDSTEMQGALAAFVGYKVKDMVRVGAEYNMITAKGNVTGEDFSGVSGYLTYIINKQFEVFGRGDYLIDDGSAVIVGLQYSPAKGVKLAPNFQIAIPEAAGSDPEPMVGVHAELKI